MFVIKYRKMKKRVIKKEATDEIGVNLLKAARMTNAEIENIVNKPQLFDSIAAKINHEKAIRSDKKSRKRFAPNFNFFVTGASVAAIFLVIAAIIFYNRPNNFIESQLAQIEPNAKPQTAKSPGEQTFSPPAETKPIVKNAERTTKNVQRNIASKRQNRSAKTSQISTNVRKTAPASAASPVENVYADEGKFYALPFADDSTDDITQIVRAGLSRAELSALGIELPLAAADDDEEILTDLIYGSNGNPKAFRLLGKL